MKFNFGKNSLAFLCILAGVVYLLILVPAIIEMMEGGIQGVKENYKSALEEKDGDHYQHFGLDSYYLKLRLKEKSNYYPDSILNTATQSMLPARYETIDVNYKNKEGQTLWNILFTMIMFIAFYPILVLLVCIPILFYKLIFSLYRGHVFTPKNITRIWRIGLFCIIVYIYFLLFKLHLYFQAKAVIDLEKYRVAFPMIGSTILLFGVIALIIAVVMKRAIEIKEEQDLTI